MTENRSDSAQPSKVPIDDEIEFVPNMSSLQGGGLQLWMNALQSTKDVHCNLTSENGLLKITLLGPMDESQAADSKSRNGPNLQRSSQNLNTTEKSNHSSLPSSSKNIKANISRPTVKPHVNTSRHSPIKKSSDPKTAVSPNASAIVEKPVENDDNDTKSTESVQSTIVVTVSPEKNIENSPNIKNLPSDPGIFPCCRQEWFENPNGSELFKSIDDDAFPSDSICINTIALAADMRSFLKHHSISLGTFSKNYLERSQGTLSDLLNHPKPWICLSSRGRSIYTKMMKFLSSDDLLDTVEKYKKGSESARRGPPTDSLPEHLMKLLADKKMPSTAYIKQVARDHKLSHVQVHTYCQLQMKQSADSYDVVVEFEDEKLESTQSQKPNSSEQNEDKEVVLKSGFQPRSFDKHICPVFGCGLILGAKLTLKHHLLTHSGQRPHTCKECGQNFVTLNNLRSHQKRHQAAQKVSKRAQRAAILKLQADSVTQNFYNEDEEERSSDLDVTSAPDTPTKSPTPKTRSYTCLACSAIFKTQTLLRSHVIDRHATAVTRNNCRLYACRICQKLFKTVRSLHIHQKSHTRGRSYECHHCKKRFFTSYNCKRHMLSHTDTRNFACPHCPARFSESKNLTNHMRLHTGDKPYQCKVCHKSFTQQSSLQSHLLLHTGVRPFLCDICGKAFRQKSNLRVHENRHHSRCTFVCRICSMPFTSSSDYHRHCLTHSNERRFACCKCSMSYTRFSYLTQHIQKVHSLSPFKCNKCGDEVSTKTAFLNHRCEISDEKILNKEENIQLYETVPSESGLSSTIFQVFPNAVCCISPMPDRDPDPQKNSLPQEVTSFTDPSFVDPDQPTSFPLDHNSSVPVALVTDNVYVLAAPSDVESSVIVEQAEVTPNDSSFESLSKLPPGKVLCATMQDDNDPNMHSVIVAADEYDHSLEGASYVMVNVADDVTVLNANLAS